MCVCVCVLNFIRLYLSEREKRWHDSNCFCRVSFAFLGGPLGFSRKLNGISCQISMFFPVFLAFCGKSLGNLLAQESLKNFKQGVCLTEPI